MADIRTALQKLSRGQALTDEEAAMIGYTQPATPVSTTPVSTRTGLTASDFGPGEIPVQAQNTGDITSDRYTAGAKRFGLTPTTDGATGPINIPVYTGNVNTNANANANVNANTGATGLPAGFTAGPFPAGLEKLFGSSAGYLGYRIESDVDKDGKTFFRLSVLTSPNSWQTFGAAFTQGPNGYESFSPNYGTKGAGPSGPSGPTGPTATYTAPDGRIFTDLGAYNAYIAQTAAEAKRRAGQSAYDLLFTEFDRYGLGALVEPLKGFIVEGLSPAEFTLRLRQTDAYQKRFAANAQRIKSGLRALSEAEYITLEDQYQNVMRNYGLPASYYARGDMGVQQGFEKFIAGDVSAAELEDRIQTAQNRVINAAPEVSKALREFYPDITGGDILAYALDPQQALTNIKRKVGAAEIGAGAMQAGLATGLTRAEELQKFGVTGQQAREGFQTIAGLLPSATKLGDIYTKQGLGPYTQTTAEQEVFGITGAAEAAAKRRKLAQLETAQFSGSTGMAGGALGRERAGQF